MHINVNDEVIEPYWNDEVVETEMAAIRARLAEWLVYDDEVAEPVSGELIKLGLCLNRATVTQSTDTTESIESREERTLLQGRLSWHFSDAANALEWFVVDMKGYRICFELLSSTVARSYEVGNQIRVEGDAYVLGGYQYQDWSIPDIRAEWRVLSATRPSETSSSYTLQLQAARRPL